MTKTIKELLEEFTNEAHRLGQSGGGAYTPRMDEIISQVEALVRREERNKILDIIHERSEENILDVIESLNHE